MRLSKKISSETRQVPKFCTRPRRDRESRYNQSRDRDETETLVLHWCSIQSLLWVLQSDPKSSQAEHFRLQSCLSFGLAIQENLLLVCKIKYCLPCNWGNIHPCVQDSEIIPLVGKSRKQASILINPLTLCHPGGEGGQKDPQLSKSLNALKLVFKSGQNVFDFSNDDLGKIFDQKF